MSFKHYLKENDLFNSMFDDVRDRIKKRGKSVSSKHKTENDTMTLYHGSKANLDSLKDGNKFTLDPQKSQQGLLWFTHSFIRGYAALEYAKDHGKFVIKYPLQIKKHFIETQYEDGSIKTIAPPEMVEKIDHTENSNFLSVSNYCIELPSGWYFTYKNEKFIGTNNKISFSKEMLV